MLALHCCLNTLSRSACLSRAQQRHSISPLVTHTYADLAAAQCAQCCAGLPQPHGPRTLHPALVPRSSHQRQSCCARLCQEAQLAPVLLGQADETLPHLSIRADVLAELGDDLSAGLVSAGAGGGEQSGAEREGSKDPRAHGRKCEAPEAPRPVHEAPQRCVRAILPLAGWARGGSAPRGPRRAGRRPEAGRPLGLTGGPLAAAQRPGPTEAPSPPRRAPGSAARLLFRGTG